MTSFDDDFDSEHDLDHDEESGDPVEARIWHLLLLINPGDEDMAMQQFAAYREAMTEAAEDTDPVEVIARIIDWRSGFQVDADDTHALVQAVDELAARWNLSIDWNGDPDDDDFHDDMDAASLFSTAYDYLAQFGYTLWAWETDEGNYAGWITQTRDNEPMRELATDLRINMRLGSDVT
ncbi:hypothetical protein EC912_10468 [Luteibacter rhizovicinus]|uniref:DUF6630 domain-containing protein n=1 Tax=Luteibacter rhizovicinus TaxID=242606 RepID=A0A4R3YRJ3_9GAMM|nr:hypothetical protein [Luteibacter rhizovicinus]TCV93874.1 hypothetical protein EC912_10468 [Luteibacter rhizovicinus]